MNADEHIRPVSAGASAFISVHLRFARISLMQPQNQLESGTLRRYEMKKRNKATMKALAMAGIIGPGQWWDAKLKHCNRDNHHWGMLGLFCRSRLFIIWKNLCRLISDWNSYNRKFGKCRTWDRHTFDHGGGCLRVRDTERHLLGPESCSIGELHLWCGAGSPVRRREECECRDTFRWSGFAQAECDTERFCRNFWYFRHPWVVAIWKNRCGFIRKPNSHNHELWRGSSRNRNTFDYRYGCLRIQDTER